MIGVAKQVMQPWLNKTVTDCGKNRQTFPILTSMSFIQKVADCQHVQDEKAIQWRLASVRTSNTDLKSFDIDASLDCKATTTVFECVCLCRPFWLLCAFTSWNGQSIGLNNCYFLLKTCTFREIVFAWEDNFQVHRGKCSEWPHCVYIPIEVVLSAYSDCRCLVWWCKSVPGFQLAYHQTVIFVWPLERRTKRDLIWKTLKLGFHSKKAIQHDERTDATYELWVFRVLQRC